MANKKIICEAHLREFILEKAKTLRLGWNCKAVSQLALDQLEGKFRAIVIDCVKRHPTIGKTFKEII